MFFWLASYVTEIMVLIYMILATYTIIYYTYHGHNFPNRFESHLCCWSCAIPVIEISRNKKHKKKEEKKTNKKKQKLTFLFLQEVIITQHRYNDLVWGLHLNIAIKIIKSHSLEPFGGPAIEMCSCTLNNTIILCSKIISISMR